MNSLAEFEKGLDKFKGKVEGELKEISVISANTVLLKVIQQSPDPTKSRSKDSKGCYVLSHRVAADVPNAQFTFWTGNRKITGAKSKAAGRARSWAKKAVKKPYQKTIISNSIPYAESVEIGLGWSVPGYYPYKLAYQFIRNQIPAIIQSVTAKKR